VFDQALAVTLGAPPLPLQVRVFPSPLPDDEHEDEDVRFQVSGAAAPGAAAAREMLMHIATESGFIIVRRFQAVPGAPSVGGVRGE
jgi:hypothetical protein